MAVRADFDDYERIPWDTFQSRFRWRQGEHMLVIAPTGQGKTTLMAQLTPMREYSLILGTKVRDETYTDFVKAGFKRVESIDEIEWYDRKILLWPRYRNSINEYKVRQRYEFRRAFDWAAGVGGWTIWNDEELYMCDDLKLESEVKYFLFQARAGHLTIINGTQRPAFIPLGSYSGATHAFLWGTNIDADEKRLRDLGKVHPGELMHNLRRLKRFEFVYLNTRNSAPPVISKVSKGVTATNESPSASVRSGRLRKFSLRDRSARTAQPRSDEVRR